MACLVHWNSWFPLGGHQLARALVRDGWEVAYVSNPLTPSSFARGFLGRDVRLRLALHRGGGRRDLDGRLWAYVPLTPLPMMYRGWVMREWHRFSVPPVRRVVAEHGFGEVELLYIDSFIQSCWLDLVPHRRSVLRIADRTAAFPYYNRAVADLETRLIRAVDLVVHSAASVEDYVVARQPKAHMHLPNGVDYARFAGNRDPEPAEYRGLPRPIAVYVGAIEPWFHFSLLQQVAAALPGVSFVLVGRDSLARRKLRPAPNLHLLGSRPYEQVPAYLRHAQLGLIPFDVAGQPELVHGVSPLKLYEYLASGLPVVATAWEELRRLEAPAALAETAEEFAAAVAATLAAPPDPARLAEFARGAGWDRRARALLARLELAGDGLEASP